MNCCNICGEDIQSVTAYVLHCKLHRNEPRRIFKCVGTSCKQVFWGYTALKLHFYRHHNSTPTVTQDVTLTPLKCTVSLCERQCEGTKRLIAHLKEHIAEGRHVACPVSGCKIEFTAKTSFTSHMSRKHRHWSENVPLQGLQYRNLPVCQMMKTLDGCNFSNLYLINICMFYMKLQGQHLLPVSTIQNIIEEMQNIHKDRHILWID